MTRKEAIRLLGMMEDSFSCTKQGKALTIAIEALRQPEDIFSCDGCIWVGFVDKCEDCRRLFEDLNDNYESGENWFEA